MNHYLFDCKCYDKECSFLSNERYIFYNLKRMASMHKLSPVSEPILRPNYECDIDDMGISAILFLEDGGHIVFHSFVRKHRYCVDILTYKDELEKAKAYLNKFMPYEDIKTYHNVVLKKENRL